MNVSDVPDNLNTFLEEYMEHIGEDAKEIRRDLQLIRDLDEKYSRLTKDIDTLKSELLETAERRVKEGNVDNHEELLAGDPLFRQFKDLTDQAIATAEEKVQLSQRMMRLMDNSIQKLSGKIDKYSEECRTIENAHAEMARAAEVKSSKKRNKTETVSSHMEVEQAERYCICNRPAFGDMIYCDNETCSIKWYHIGCIGLDKVPDEDRWYCPSCRDKMK